MSLPRFLIEDTIDGSTGSFSVTLAPSELHHMRVARVSPGEHVALIAPDGLVWEVEVRNLGVSDIGGLLVGPIALPSTPQVTLLCGVSKGERMDLSIRGATELGVRRIVPLEMDRCVVHLVDPARAQKRLERWRKIAQSACQQSSQVVAPQVEETCSLSKALSRVVEEYDLLLMAWEDQKHGSIRSEVSRAMQSLNVTPQNLRAGIIIGPEGGITESEVERARSCGAIPVSLGPTILRCETACLVGSALLIHELGGLGNQL